MRKTAVLLLIVCLLLTACGAVSEPAAGENNDPAVRSIYAMNTIMKFTVYGSDGEAAIDMVVEEINSLESRISTTEETSQVAQLNRAGIGELDDELIALLYRCLNLQQLTGGALRPDLYRLTSLWGFTTGEYRVPSQGEIDEVLSGLQGETPVVIDGNTVTLQGVSIDFGAVGKGYTSQCVAELLKARGVTSALVTLGGNVQTVGLKPNGSLWRVGIQSPWDSSAMAGVLSVGETAVITSGGYERYFEEDGVTYIHIMDPETGYPVDNDLASVTIVAADGTMADAYSTALFVMGAENAAQFWRDHSDSFQAVLILKDGTIRITEGLKGCFSGASYDLIT